MDNDCKTPVTRAELERENKHLRELMNVGFESRDTALRLQGLEYERRLEVLNDAHARAEKAAATTVPRIVYDTFVAEVGKWREDVGKWREDVAVEFASLKAVSTTNTRFFTILTVILGLLFSALSIWLRTK